MRRGGRPRNTPEQQEAAKERKRRLNVLAYIKRRDAGHYRAEQKVVDVDSVVDLPVIQRRLTQEEWYGR